MKRRVLVLALVGLVVIGIAAFAVPSVRWRIQVLTLYANGEIPDITLADIFKFMKPGSDQTLSRLVSTRNPYAVILNRRNTPEDLRAGALLFRDRCAMCHAPDASGTARAPSLVGRDFKHGESDWAVFRTIRSGVPNTAMAAQPLPDEHIWQLVGYLRSIDTGIASIAEKPAINAVPVPYDELRSIREPAEDWLTYSGSYRSARHSALTQIDPSNVSQLALQWVYQFDEPPMTIESSPIVRKGVMYVTAAPGSVHALDAASGTTLWSYSREPDSATVEVSSGIINRGVAVLDDKVFVGTWDCHVIALSASSGEVLWDSMVVADKRYLISAAPLAYRDLVVTGVGTAWGGRGVIVAFDANTGEERWRFTTIPDPGEPGNDTWAGDSWREGGAPTWLTGSYDVEQDLLVWGVGNPKPDNDAEARKGDNLYSNSVIALKGTTGELVWHFQFTPNDSRDWDSNQIPVFADYESQDGPQRRVLWANRNGFYYVIDRDSGRYIRSTPFVHQNWTAGIDPNGRPLPRKQEAKREEGYLIHPSANGGTNWWSPAFNPSLNLFFVPALEQGMVFFTSAESWPLPSGKPFYTAVRALDANTGALVWEHRNAPRLKYNEMGGLLSTASGLVFGADLSSFFALDARTGNLLWSVQTGGRVRSAPVTFAVNGKQHVAIAGGNVLLTFALPTQVSLSSGKAPAAAISR
jgi:alcohol dehydrogenase (cytochrome c)